MAYLLKNRCPFNYIYFGTLFILLVFLHLFHISLVETGTLINKVFYAIHAIGQSFIEIGALSLISTWTAAPLFIGATFFLFLLHVVDFPLVRILDISVWCAMNFVRAETFQNFIEMLKATSVSLLSWTIFAIISLALVIFGFLFFKYTRHLSSRRPFYFSYRAAAFALCVLLGLLIVFETQTSTFAAVKEDDQFLKALPWKTTFVTPTYNGFRFSSSLSPLLQNAYKKQLLTFDVRPKHLPNIYLFIAESLREDFLLSEYAPKLDHFRQENIAFAQGISAANATHLSWLSIFHSAYPFAWQDRQPSRWSFGSLPLQLLKQAGYQIHVFSASEFNFYQMDKILFGKNRELVDTYHVFTNQETYVCDTQCIDYLIEKMEHAQEGHLFLVFFEGTHFNYSWPPEKSLPQFPAASGIDYLQISYSKANLEGVKNRYRNAIAHIDHQFGRFQKKLKEHPKAKEAVVIFTSDHGEEFFEEGRLFHASHLNTLQTRVPIYYQLTSQAISHHSITSHLDIFPTILDHVFGQIPHADWFDGESILRPRQKLFAISARYNASRNPYEFLITTEAEKALVRFDNKTHIKAAQSLEFIFFRDSKGEFLYPSQDEIADRYGPICRQLFK